MYYHRVREELNSRSDGKYKISVNDFIIKVGGRQPA